VVQRYFLRARPPKPAQSEASDGEAAASMQRPPGLRPLHRPKLRVAVAAALAGGLLQLRSTSLASKDPKEARLLVAPFVPRAPLRQRRRIGREGRARAATATDTALAPSKLEPKERHVDLMYPHLGSSKVAILARGENWAVVYNPAGTIAHPHEFRSWATANSLVQRLRRTFGRPVHLVHRLDRQVSGLSLVALDPQTCHAMHQALVGPRSTKTYYALCRGNGGGFIERGSFVLDRPLRDKWNRNSSLRHQMKNASTEVTVLCGSNSPGCCLVRVQPKTGRYQQIRRHLRNISLPVLGDSYGRSGVREEWATCGVPLPDRVFLHLHAISLPATGRTPQLELACPLPPDVISLIRRACPSWAGEAEASLPALFAPPPPIVGPDVDP